METSRLPFDGETPEEVVHKHEQQPSSPQQINPALAEQVERDVLHGPAKEPTEWPASSEEFVQKLRDARQKPSPQTEDLSEEAALTPWSKRLREQIHTSQSPFSTVPAPTTWGIQPPAPDATSQVATAHSTQDNAQPTFHATTAEPASRSEPHSTLDTPLPPTNSPEPAASIIREVPAPQRDAETGGTGTTSVFAYIISPPAPASATIHQEAEQPLASSQPRMSRRSFMATGGAGAVVIAAGGIALYSTLQPQQPSLKTVTTSGSYRLINETPLVRLVGHRGPVWNVAWDPTGRYLATGGEDHHVLVWDLASHLTYSGNSPVTLSQPLRSWQLPNAIGNNAISWSSDGRGLVVTTAKGAPTIYFLDVFGTATRPIEYFDLAQSQSAHRPGYWYSAWAPHQNYFATAIYQSTQVALWKQGLTTSPLTTLPYDGPATKAGHPLYTLELAWSTDGSLLAGVTNDLSVIIWDSKTAKVKQTLTLPGLPSTSNTMSNQRGALAWSPISPQTLAVSQTNEVLLWDIQQNTPYRQLGTDDHATNPPSATPATTPTNGMWSPNVTGISWSPNGRYIIGGYGGSYRLYIWDLQAKAPKLAKGVQMPDLIFGDTHGQSGTIIDVAWSPNGRYVVSSSSDASVMVWNLASAQ